MKMKIKNNRSGGEVSLTQYWRWQFLRLNERYQKDYDQYSAFLRKLIPRPNLHAIRKSEFKERLQNQYGINDLYDYRQEEFPATGYIEGEADLPILLRLPPRVKQYGPAIFKTPYHRDHTLLPKYLRIYINLDSTPADIVTEINNVAGKYRDARKRHLGIKRKKTIIKRAIADLKLCLKGWRLYQENIPTCKIAKRLFPRECTADSRAAESKTCDYRNRASLLILKAYRTIYF